MAVTLLRYVVDDIAKDLRQTFDDKEIQPSQIAYWVLMVGNRLRAQHIEKRSSGAFLHTFVGIPVEKVAATSNPNTAKGRKRITLPESIYDYNNDRGIDYIAYWLEEEAGENCPPRFTSHTFTRTTPKQSERLYYDKDEKPSPSNPYFYRTGESVYFLGIEKVNVREIEIGIFSTFDPLTSVDLDAPFDFPEELLMILKRQVLDLGRFSLMVPEERKNDGSSDTNPSDIPQTKLVSVNDPLNQTEQ
jgi:hypothetical protein